MRVAGAALFFLIILASGCGDKPASAGSSADPYASLRIEMVNQIKLDRQEIGLGPLEHNVARSTCCDSEARSDSETGIAHGAFQSCGETAQNECPGYSSLEGLITGCLSSMWAEGPPPV